jgi:hypothetical protein
MHPVVAQTLNLQRQHLPINETSAALTAQLAYYKSVRGDDANRKAQVRATSLVVATVRDLQSQAVDRVWDFSDDSGSALETLSDRSLLRAYTLH